MPKTTAINILSSVGPHGIRIDTLELSYPAIIHPQLLTHRALSRNSASSRALPAHSVRQQVWRDPWTPKYLGSEKRGMQPGCHLTGLAASVVPPIYSGLGRAAVATSWLLSLLGLHHSLCNYLLFPWRMMRTVVTATDWKHFLDLRLNYDTEPHMQELARSIKHALETAKPIYRNPGDWHAPYLRTPGDDDLSPRQKLQVSVARCARVSYLTHDKRRDPDRDLNLYRQLIDSRHWSPAEHVARCLKEPVRIGNFRGWQQHRKEFSHEHTV